MQLAYLQFLFFFSFFTFYTLIFFLPLPLHCSGFFVFFCTCGSLNMPSILFFLLPFSSSSTSATHVSSVFVYVVLFLPSIPPFFFSLSLFLSRSSTQISQIFVHFEVLSCHHTPFPSLSSSATLVSLPF